MADERSFIEREQDFHENVTGERPSPETLRDQFHLFGPAKRVPKLEALDAELSEALSSYSGGNDADLSGIKRILELQNYRDGLREKHKKLLKAGR